MSTPKGYRLEQFAEAFERYLSIPPNQTATTPQGAENLAFPEFFDPQRQGQRCGPDSAGNPKDSAGCGVVADRKGGEGESDGVETWEGVLDDGS
jgi:hypothetical protein